jgi:hypothetical protein
MEKLKEVLDMILKNIIETIDIVFLILEAPYIIVMSIFLYYGKCNIVYLWFPSFGVMSMWIGDWTGKIEYSIDGHTLIKKLFKK